MKRQLAQRRDTIDAGAVNQNADVHDAIPLQHGRGFLAEHGGVYRRRHICGGQAEPLCICVAHTQADRRASVDQSIFGIHDAFNLLQLLLDFRRFLFQEFHVSRKQLHFDWLGRPGQVADKVAEDTGELPLNARQSGIKLGAQFAGDSVGVAFAIRLEFHEKITGVRLGDSQSEPRAGAAGEAFHVGGGGKDLFGEQELAVSFCEAGARRRDVVDDECAFVHRREEFAFQALVNANAKQQHRATGAERQPAVAQSRTHGDFVSADDSLQQEPTVVALGCVAGFQAPTVACKPSGKRRRQGNGEHQRGQQRHHHG